MKLIIFCLVCFGMTNIITMSRLFKLVRDRFERLSKKAGIFIKCPMCVGFWVGLLWSLLEFGPVSRGLWNFKFEISFFINLFADACISSGISWILYVLCCAIAGPEYEKL